MKGMLEGSGSWLLGNTTFKEWLDFEKSGLFWLHGKRKLEHPLRG
jgi:hypothetical protein